MALARLDAGERAVLGESSPGWHTAAAHDPAKVHLVLDAGAGPAGYLTLAAPRGPEPGVELHRLVVAPTWRGTGIGRALLRTALHLTGTATAPARPEGHAGGSPATPAGREGHPRGPQRHESAPRGSQVGGDASDAGTGAGTTDSEAGTTDGEAGRPQGHLRGSQRHEGAPRGNKVGGASDAGTTDSEAGRPQGHLRGPQRHEGAPRGIGVGGAELEPGWVPPGWLAAGRIWLEVAPDNAPALRLYRSAGLVIETRLPSVPGDPDSPPLRLVLSCG